VSVETQAATVDTSTPGPSVDADGPPPPVSPEVLLDDLLIMFASSAGALPGYGLERDLSEVAKQIGLIAKPSEQMVFAGKLVAGLTVAIPHDRNPAAWASMATRILENSVIPQLNAVVTSNLADEASLRELLNNIQAFCMGHPVQTQTQTQTQGGGVAAPRFPLAKGAWVGADYPIGYDFGGIELSINGRLEIYEGTRSKPGMGGTLTKSLFVSSEKIESLMEKFSRDYNENFEPGAFPQKLIERFGETGAMKEWIQRNFSADSYELKTHVTSISNED